MAGVMNLYNYNSVSSIAGNNNRSISSCQRDCDSFIDLCSSKVALLKKRLQVGPDGSLPPEGEVPQSEAAEVSASPTQSPLKENEVEPEVIEGKCIY